MNELMQEIDVTGIILPNSWDQNGRIVDIAIYTNTEQVYGVEHNSLIAKLMNLVHKRVEVKGKIRKRLHGHQSIAVQNFIVLEEIDDDAGKTNAKEGATTSD
jgi:hypothetical protein